MAAKSVATAFGLVFIQAGLTLLDGFGGLYLNRDDPAVFVPKRFGIDWTINFGNPRSIALLIVLLTALILPAVLR